MKNFTLLFALVIASSISHAQVSAENDLTLSAVSYANYQPDTDTTYRNLAYSIYHISQIRPLTFSGTATNSGSNAQTGVQLKVIVSNDLGYSEILFSDTLSLDPGMEQEIQIPEYMPPDQIAHYSIYYELLSDSLDENPADNFGEKEFEISEYYFARDRGVSEGGFTDFEGEYILGKFFHIEEQPDGGYVSLYCVEFVLSDLSDPGAYAGVVILDSNFEFITEGTYSIYTTEANLSSIGEGTFVSVCMMFAVPLFGGADVFVGIRNNGGPNDAVVAVETEVEANSAYLISDSTISVNVNPIIRLGMGNMCKSLPWCIVGIESIVGKEATKLYPNPATDQITLEYTLSESAPLEIRITDVNGRVVHHENTGKLPVGEQRSVFNIQHLPPGVYALNLIHNGEVISNKFVVQR